MSCETSANGFSRASSGCWRGARLRPTTRATSVAAVAAAAAVAVIRALLRTSTRAYPETSQLTAALCGARARAATFLVSRFALWRLRVVCVFCACCCCVSARKSSRVGTRLQRASERESMISVGRTRHTKNSSRTIIACCYCCCCATKARARPRPCTHARTSRTSIASSLAYAKIKTVAKRRRPDTWRAQLSLARARACAACGLHSDSMTT